MKKILLTMVLAVAVGAAAAQSTVQQNTVQQFAKMDDAMWVERMYDPGTDDWTQRWFLDGERAMVANTPKGIRYTAGPTLASDADHTVLWTKKSFRGDIKIEYDFVRLDSLYRFVNIIFIQAEGNGAKGYAKNIRRWSVKRHVPAMKQYFDHMNTYHISYAAFENTAGIRNADYVRGRRYMPDAGKGLDGTDLKPEYLSPGLFEPGVEYRITVIKRGRELMMRTLEKSTGTEYYFFFSAADFPPIDAGRVGLRQMSGRESLYSDIRIWTSK